MMLKKNFLLVVIGLFPFISQAAVVNFDLSSSYDYDAYVTGQEIVANTAAVVDDNLGDHRIYNGLTAGYAHLVDPAKLSGTTYVGITNTTINGGQFELAAGLPGDKFGTADGLTKVNNSVARLNNQFANQTNRTVTCMLEVGQRAKYSDFNVLVNGQRYSTRTFNVFMSATIEVKYVGDANWYTIWSENVNINTTLNGGLAVYGGAFGGQFTSTNQNYQSAAWVPVIVNDVAANGIYKNNAPASGADTMWKLSAPAALDSSKVLEGFRMTSTTTEASRYNDFILYAASATKVITAPSNGPCFIIGFLPI